MIYDHKATDDVKIIKRFIEISQMIYDHKTTQCLYVIPSIQKTDELTKSPKKFIKL